MSTRRRTAGVHSRKRPLGPNGEKICYNCGGPLPKGRPFNCSPKCSEEWQCKTSPSHLRYVLNRRDKGICALCGIDTHELERQYSELPKHPPEPREEFLKAHGIPHGRACSDFWDADHITPVVEGGGECGPEGFRTLCIPCHQRVTRELRQRMSQRRKEQIIIAKDQERGLLEGL